LGVAALLAANRSSRYRRNWIPSEHYKDVRVAEAYDRTRFTSLPGRVFDGLEKACLRRALRELPPGSRLVDAPCGTGRLAETLLAAGHRVVGIDISPAMLRVAGDKLARFGDRFEGREGDVLALGDDRSFDAALCARVLMHFPLEEQIAFLRRVAALSRGPVVFTHSLDTPYQRARRRAKRWLRHQRPVAFPVAEAQLAELLAGAGLREMRRHRPFAPVSEAVIVLAARR